MATKNDVVASAADVIDEVLGDSIQETGCGEVGGEAGEVGEVIDAEFEVAPDGIDDIPTIPGLQAEVARLTEQLTFRERLEADISAESLAVDRAASEVLRCEGNVEEAKGDLKSAKERYDKRVNALRDLVRDMAVGQGRLEFDKPDSQIVTELVAAAAVALDPATEAPVSELGKKKLKEIVGAEAFDAAKEIDEPIGLTPGQVETIEDDGCLTIADLEKKLRDYPLFLQDLKGFGPSAQGRLSMSLAAWRKVNPEPVVSESPPAD